MPLPQRRISRYFFGACTIIALTVLLLRRVDTSRFWSEAQTIKQKGDSILFQELQSLEQQGLSPAQLWKSGSQHNFQPGAPVDGQNYTKRIVVPKTKKEDIRWLDEELPEVPKAVYAVDDATAPLRPPKNKGNEVMVYLSYIIDHYEELADVNIFIHAHRWAWHNNDLLDSDTAQMIRHLSSARVLREGYVNLRCQWFPGCPSWLNPSADREDEEKKEQKHIAKAWLELFPGSTLPDVLAQPCCSQFAVSRDRIRAIPLAEYERLRRWVLVTKLGSNMSGRVFEYLWQFIFAGTHALCPSIHTCYCDGYGYCFADEEDFQSWFKMRFELRQDEWELHSWLDNEAKYEELVSKGKGGEARRVERAPAARLKELKMGISRRWIELWEKREQALLRGQDAQIRAKIAGRVVASDQDYNAT
jgi:hypothetical protein